jgi:hypothetical protein
MTALTAQRIRLHLATAATVGLRFAASELQRGLYQLGLHDVTVATGSPSAPPTHEQQFTLISDGGVGESFQIRQRDQVVILHGSSDQAVGHAVMEFLERQGAVFGLDGEYYPLERTRLRLPGEQEVWAGTPLFATRGLLPWPDFLNCVTTHNREDWRAYLEQMRRMRFNTVGIHVYTQSEKWAEAFLGFEFAGVGHNAFLDTTATDRWGYLPQRTSSYGMGAAQFFDGEVFGADNARNARNPWEAIELASQELQNAFAFAERLGIQTGIGFEPLQLPEEIVRACPPTLQRKLVIEHPRVDGAIRRRQFEVIDPYSKTAKRITEERLARMLEAYPNVAHVYLWESEFIHWSSRIHQIDEEPLLMHTRYAHDFLRQHAPDKRLVLAGWGGFVRNFARHHQELAGDIIFAAHSDQFGQDYIHEAFAGLEGRECWPIPWVEDDPNMWFPQLHTHRFEQDLERAEGFGCQGIMGNHWRHRSADPVASYMARRSWHRHLSLEQHYTALARTHASPERAGDVRQWFLETDRERKILCTWTGEQGNDGHAKVQEFSPDFNEGFRVDWNYDVSDDFVQAQHEHVERLGDLMRQATHALERERLAYWYAQTAFVDHYARAWQQGRALHTLLLQATSFRASSPSDAAQLVTTRALPHWIKLLGHTRDAMLAYQRGVLTRQDLGTLASLQNKFVRIATHRFRLWLLEFLDAIPERAEQAYRDCLDDDSSLEPTLLVLTRPTRLAVGEQVCWHAITLGVDAPESVELRWRPVGQQHWQHQAMSLQGRRTYQGLLEMPAGAGAGLELRVVASWAGTPSLTLTYPVTDSHLISTDMPGSDNTG